MGTPVKVFRSLTRPPDVGGGEREPMGLVVGGGILMLAYAWQFWSVLCLVIGLLMLTVGVYFVKRIYKRDPIMFRIYRRFLLYRAYYPARSRAYRRS